MSTTTADIRSRRTARDTGADGAGRNAPPQDASLSLVYLKASIASVADPATRQRLTELQGQAQASGGSYNQIERELVNRLTQAVLDGGKAQVALAAEVIDFVSDAAKSAPGGELLDNQRQTAFLLLDAIGSGKLDEGQLEEVLSKFRELSQDADGFTEADAQTIRKMLESLKNKDLPAANGAGAADHKSADTAAGSDNAAPAIGAGAAADTVAKASANGEDAARAMGAAAAVDTVAKAAATDDQPDSSGAGQAGARGVEALRAADNAHGNWLTYAAEEEIGATLTLAQANDPAFINAFAARLNAQEDLAVNAGTADAAQARQKEEALQEAHDFAAAVTNHAIPLECIDYYAANLTPEEAADEAFMAMLASYSLPLAGKPHDPADALSQTRARYEYEQATPA